MSPRAPTRVLGVDDALFTSKPDLHGGRRRKPGASDEPSHLLIERWLAEVIGRLSAGDKLPAEGALAATLGVSRMTLRQSLAALEDRGLLVRKRGRAGGTFVAVPRIECDLTGLPGFTEQMRRANLRPGARVLEARVVAADDPVSSALDLPRRAPVHRIVRVRSANREPLALEETYLSVRDFPDLLQHRLNGSLYSLMRRTYGLAPHSAREWLEPVIAQEEEARLLDTTPGSALMLVTRTAYTANGRPVEHAYDRWRGDRTRIALQTGIAQRVDRPTLVQAELKAEPDGG